MSSLVSVIVSMLISLIAMGGFVAMSNAGIKNVKAASVATQTKIINNAFTQYVNDNSVAIATTATASNPVSITIPALVCAGYLPNSYNSAPWNGYSSYPCPAPSWSGSGPPGGSLNAYHQGYYAQVLQPTTGKLQTLVFTTGGAAISATQQVSIASLIGAQGGFIPYNHQAGDTTLVSTIAQGSFGIWTVPLSGYTAPPPGHLASLLSYTTVQAAGFLSRYGLAGQPQVNTMSVPILMNSTEVPGTTCPGAGAIANDANGGSLVCWQTINGLAWTQLVAAPASNVASLPTCSASNANQMAVVQNSNGGAPAGTTGSVYECNAGIWNPVGVDANGNLNVPNIATVNQLDIQAQNAIDSACSKQGLISVDPTGIVVTCGSHLTWEQSGQNVTAPNGACTTPGLQARDSNNNTYMCN